MAEKKQESEGITEAELRRIAREEADKAHDEREAKKVNIKDDTDHSEPEPPAEEKTTWPCPNPQCGYVGEAQFERCKDCGVGPINWSQTE